MTDIPRPSFKRIVFKPSGEALAGDSGSGLDGATLDATAAEIIHLRQDLGVDVAVRTGLREFGVGDAAGTTGDPDPFATTFAAWVTPTAPGVTEAMLAAELEPITLITESNVTGIEYAARNTQITPTLAA